jgi:hypothetical protein
LLEELLPRHPGARCALGSGTGHSSTPFFFLFWCGVDARIEVLVTGSLHLVGGVLKVVDYDEVADGV